MKYSLGFRLWHWLNAVVIVALLGTVFLRKTFLSWKTNAELLMSKLHEMGIEITAGQAKILAQAIRDNMWQWHIVFGYVLAFLVLYRIYLFFNDKSEKEAFSSLTLHKKGVRTLYYVFYVTLIFMSVSGLVIHFYELLNLTKEMAHNIAEMHESVFNFIMVFVLIHIAGIIIAENRDEKGLVSTMIHGERE
ncbi:MAG: cytochrome b/b6 domain-containing protein [Campylobacterales bacterium]|nr:cytochrome b/b6 domain-containing protein [Campylobacterales bacterium]